MKRRQRTEDRKQMTKNRGQVTRPGLTALSFVITAPRHVTAVGRGQEGWNGECGTCDGRKAQGIRTEKDAVRLSQP